MADARRILFPTRRFAKIFQAAGKDTFPSAFTYAIRKSVLVQETFFQFSGCPHPRTRFYYGRQKASALADFSFPFLVMGPLKSDGVYRVTDAKRFMDLAGRLNPLIVQENIRYTELFRLVFVNYECIAAARHALRSGICDDASRRGVEVLSSPGASIIRVSRLPQSSADLRLSSLLSTFRIDDVAVEIGLSEGGACHILSVNRPPVSCPCESGTINRHEYISALIGERIL